MGWAGALEGIFESYAEDFDAHPLNLYQNFRSEPRLRRMQNAMVRVMDPPAAIDDDDLPGDEGEIEVLRLDNDDDEANALADAVCGWIDDEGVDPAEIAVLVSKQQNLYCQKLRAALDAKGVPYRDEDATQNLASEPVANLIVDFLLVAAGQRQPGPFQRLLDLVVFGRGLDQENEYRARSRWNRFIAAVKQRLAAEEADLSSLDDLRTIVGELLDIVGRDAVVGLSSEYAQGDYLQQQIDATIVAGNAEGVGPEGRTVVSDHALDGDAQLGKVPGGGLHEAHGALLALVRIHPGEGASAGGRRSGLRVRAYSLQ